MARGSNLKAITDGVPKCNRTFLTQKHLETYLIEFLRIVRRGGKVVEEIDTAPIVHILHRGCELLGSEPMLIEAPFPDDGLVVVGDLHGHIHDLIFEMLRNGSPLDKHYIFLGDYVDKGPFQIETFIFVLLLKLRWPDRVYILRGNHETYESSVHNQFYAVCKRAFGNDQMYHEFSRLFDVMPVAAIFDDVLLCVHGGVSQWMISRDNIRNIKRPTCVSSMKMLDCCLLADILWADIIPEQKRAFEASQRNVGYSFNADGLDLALNALNVKTLIRGHQPFAKGCVENVPGKCFTVQTTPCVPSPFFAGAVLVCHRDGTGYHINSSSHSILRETHLLQRCVNMEIMLKAAFTSLYTASTEANEHCGECAIRISQQQLTKPRLLSHLEMADWVQRYATRLVLDDNAFARIADKPQLVTKRFVRLFPVFFDILYLNGETFRIFTSSTDNKLIKKYHGKETSHDRRYAIASSATNPNVPQRVINATTAPYTKEPGLPYLDVAPGAHTPVKECMDEMRISNNESERSLFSRIRTLFQRFRRPERSGNEPNSSNHMNINNNASPNCAEQSSRQNISDDAKSTSNEEVNQSNTSSDKVDEDDAIQIEDPFAVCERCSDTVFDTTEPCNQPLTST